MINYPELKQIIKQRRNTVDSSKRKLYYEIRDVLKEMNETAIRDFLIESLYELTEIDRDG